MVTLFRSLKRVEIGGIVCTFRVRSDGERIYITVGPTPGTVFDGTLNMNMTLTYGGNTEQISSAPADVTLSFPYTGEKSFTVTADSMYVSYYYELSHVFSWACEPEDMIGMEPEVNYSFDRILASSTSMMSLSVGAPDGYYARPVAVTFFAKDPNGNTYSAKCAMSEIEGVYTYVNRMNNSAVFTEGATIQYRFEVACYPDSSAAFVNDGEDFIGYTDILSPAYIVSSSSGKSTPFDLKYEFTADGEGLLITWSTHLDSSVYVLERSVNGGEFTEVYNGIKSPYTDSIGADWKKVAYRVKSSGSPWWVGESMSVVRSNLYVGTAGEISAASGLYVGDGGGIIQLPAVMLVGGM